MPMLTCVMTAYNEKIDIFKKAVESILSQTFKDFTFVIVIDNPENKELINETYNYSQIDKRVRFIVNEENMGLAMALNKGIQLVHTKYIARMDSDDIAEPTRFQMQIDYLEKHNNVDLIGTFCSVIDQNGNKLHRRSNRPYIFKHIKRCIKYMNVFVHPTFMGKSELFKSVSYRNLRYAQDYDFTSRLVEKGFVLENIPFELLQYRITDNVTDEKLARQRITCYYIQKFYSHGMLNNMDIAEVVDKEMQNVNIMKISNSVRKCNEAFALFRKKKFISGTISMFESFFSSKYQRKYIFNLIIYSILKKYYKF